VIPASYLAERAGGRTAMFDSAHRLASTTIETISTMIPAATSATTHCLLFGDMMLVLIRRAE
jgi:hypothetical protein